MPYSSAEPRKAVSIRWTTRSDTVMRLLLRITERRLCFLNSFAGRVSTKVVFTFDEMEIPAKLYPNFAENFDVSIFRNFDFDIDIGFRFSPKYVKKILSFTEISQKFNSHCLSEFRPIISSKFKINFDWNSDRHSDEINFVGNPSYGVGQNPQGTTSFRGFF
jgi:hypothetical protein